MEVSYRKNNTGSFMIITPENLNENDYKLQMVLHNHIKGLVPFTVKMLDNQNRLYFDTTGLISLKTFYAAKKITGSGIVQFVEALKRLSETLREYLLNPDCIMYDLEYIFVREKDGQYFFCYDAQGEYELNRLGEVFNGLLEYVDYEDRKAVEIVYEIQRITAGAEFTLQSIWETAERADENVQEKVEEHRELEQELLQFSDGFDEPVEDNTLSKWFKKNISRWAQKIKKKAAHQEEVEAQQFFTEQNEKSAADSTLILRRVSLEKPIVIIPAGNPYIIEENDKAGD